MPIIGVIASSDRNVPGAPTIGTATNVPSGRAYNNGRADVTFTAPTYTGGRPITGYTVTSSPGGFTGTGASSPISVTGLQSNTAYTFTVTATNAIGTSAASAASNSITATTVPQAPTIGTATDGGTGTTVSVAFTANATGGSAITGFTATSSPGSLTGTGGSSPITVSGLTAGTAYTFTVTATNANGTSTASAASNSVTPITPTAFESIASATGTGSSGTITFSSIPSTYKHLQIRAISKTTQSGTGFAAVWLRMNGISTSTYTWHYFSGDGTSATGNAGVSPTEILASYGTEASPVPLGVGIIDIHDYASTTKNKTIRSIAGYDNNGAGVIRVGSGAFLSTNAVTSLSLRIDGSFTTTTQIALYGIKG